MIKNYLEHHFEANPSDNLKKMQFVFSLHTMGLALVMDFWQQYC